MAQSKNPSYLNYVMAILFLAFCILSSVQAIEYRCPTNEVLIVQHLDVQSLRMHCAPLNVCGRDVVSPKILDFFVCSQKSP